MHFVHLKTSGFVRVLRTRDRIVRSNTRYIHSLLHAQPPFGPERWRQFWNHWKAQPQRLEGIERLRQAVIATDPAIFTEAAYGINPYRRLHRRPLRC